MGKKRAAHNIFNCKLRQMRKWDRNGKYISLRQKRFVCVQNKIDGVPFFCILNEKKFISRMW